MDIPAKDEDAIDRLRASCPAQEDETELDIEVARALLEQPDLYALALQGQLNTASLQNSVLAEGND